MARAVSLYLRVHQPWRIRPYGIFDVAARHDYFAGTGQYDNAALFRRVAERSYLPMNRLLMKLLTEHSGFRLSLSVSGSFVEQAEQFAPEVLASFQELVAIGKVELLATPYDSSLAFFYSRPEFERQMQAHRRMVQRVFGVQPRVVANTELAYDNELAAWAEEAGYDGVLAEGWDPILQWRSPNFVYRPAGTNAIRLLLRNYRLSDDIAMRFSDRNWKAWPLTAEAYMSWLQEAPGSVVVLGMDYETFGEHQWRDSGIFQFFEQVVARWTDGGRRFFTASEALTLEKPVGEISMPSAVSWSGGERDMSAWCGDALQQEALRTVYGLEEQVLASGDATLVADWRKLLASDHTRFMSTGRHTDAGPYDSPYDAFLSYMNVMRDMRWRLTR
ncbi:MAG: glycoside hydrolase family 57 protein [Candidatus Saccharibacteria bacterium]|nr:glycoside hydrolase family 57 protein [Candidatus Saccharibacteria bacterium]